ncbi:hypothetical protein [Argonema antarcticum]|uniref:hypothetical protein n=1 Tax=Argonema antarcticum TaxID=2942763 RepID=UPI002011830A|nr:hypothetical protein [Argonema antarcticum]MCL1470120.1 hypothetical protein [Argonema antarcticum A004/B2]
MTIPSELNALIERLNQELDIIDREARAGLNLARVSMERFPDNSTLIQMFAFLNNAVFYVDIERGLIRDIVDNLLAEEASTDEEIREAGEDLGNKLGRVLETKILVSSVKIRLENLQ